jgi:fibronectin-binding autotransporter adhesin
MRPITSQPQSFSTVGQLSRFCAGLLAIVALLCGGMSAQAANIVKTNNTANLNLATSWTNGVAPGAADVAQWDSTVTGANTVALGSSAIWSGIRIVNPGGTVTINPSVNAAPITMVVANSTITYASAPAIPLVNGDRVFLDGPAFSAPGGFTWGTAYYVTNATATTFRLGATYGAAIAPTSTGTNVTITGPVLTLGNSGIDMSGATADLTIQTPLFLTNGSVQTWKTTTGRTLTYTQPVATSNSVPMRIQSAGATFSSQSVLKFDTSAGGTITFSAATQMVAGATSIYGGGVVNGTGPGFANMTCATLINGTDFATVDSLQHVVPASTVMTYYTNVDSSAPSLPSGAYNVPIEVTLGSSNSSYGVIQANTTSANAGVRFNTHHQYRAAGWLWDCAARIYYINGGVNCFLVTTNVGAQNVSFTGTTHAPRWNGGEWLLQQENIYGDLIFWGSQSYTGAGGTLTKSGAGRAIFNSWLPNRGPSRVMEGTLVVNGMTDSNSAWTVYSGATLGGSGTIAGSLNVLPGGTLWPGNGTNGIGGLILSNQTTLGAGTYMKFYTPAAPTTNVAALMTISNLTVNGAVNISILSGRVAVGTYPLFKTTTALSAPTFANFSLTLPQRVLGYLNNNTANTTVDLVVTSVYEPLTWAVGDATWDINGITNNWVDTLSVPTTYQEANLIADAVVFNDSASGGPTITVTLNTNPIPPAVTVNNPTKAYVITGNGSINGVGTLTKSGAAALTLQTTNAFTGGIAINGGTVNFTTLGNLGAGPIGFGGGTLKYNGNTDDISVRPVTFNAGGGILDLNGSTVTYSNAIGSGGSGGLTLTNGTLQIISNNVYAGITTIGSGSTLSLQSSNTYISNSVAIIVNGTLDAKTNILFALSTPNNQILTGSGTVQGEVVMAGSTTITPATNGTYGTMTINGDLTVNGGTVALDIAGPTASSKDLVAINSSGFGTGNLILGGGANAGTIQLNVSPALNNGAYSLITYSGALNGSAGYLRLAGFSQSGQLAYLTSGAGSIVLNVIGSSTNKVVWTGGLNGNAWDSGTTANWIVNGVPGGCYTNGNVVTFDETGDASSPVSVKTILVPGSVTINSTNKDYTFSDGSGNASGQLTGSGGLTINSGASTITTVLVANNYTGPTFLSAGTLQIGNGSVTGDIGFGNVTNNGTLIFQQTDDRVVVGAISGTGGLIQKGASTLALLGNNTYAGQTSISNNSSLSIGVGGATGTFATNTVVNDGLLVVNRSGSLTVGNTVSGAGAFAKTGSGTLTVNGTFTYQGNTYISNGVVKLGAAEKIPDNQNVPGALGTLVMDSGTEVAGTLDMAGFNETINALSGITNPIPSLITNTATSATTTNILRILGLGPTNAYNFFGAIRDNVSGSKIAVVLLGTNSLALCANNTYAGGTYVGGTATLIANGGNALIGNGGNIVMSNGTTFYMQQQGGGTFPGNNITIAPGASFTMASSALGNGYGGLVFGGATSTNFIGANVSCGSGTMQQYSNFLGTVVVQSGGTLRFSSTGLTINGGDTNVFEIANGGTLQTRNAGTVRLGALQGEGTIGNPQANTGTPSWQIGAKNTDSVFKGIITASNSIVKIGTGQLTLSGMTNWMYTYVDPDFNQITNYAATNGLTYVGTTTVSNGVLAIVAPANLNGQDRGVSVPKPAAFTMAGSSAVLDISQMGSTTDGTNLVIDNTLYLGTNYQLDAAQTLSGFGTIRGSVIASNGTTVTLGLPTGVLTVTNSIELAGVVIANLNRTNTPNCGGLSSPTITVDVTATLVVTNVGPVLQGGEVFQLFNQPVTGFATNDLPNIAPLTWTNKLAVDGKLYVSTSTNADLLSLVVTPAGTLSPAFNSNTLSYAATEVYTNSSVTVTVVNANLTATNRLIYNGTTNIITSGVASGALTLDASPAVTNVIKVEVTSQEGVTVKTYVVNVKRLASLTPPPPITNSFDGVNLTLSWPLANTTYRLLAQTNASTVGLTTNWVEWVGASATNKVIIPVDNTKETIFYRLIYP